MQLFRTRWLGDVMRCAQSVGLILFFLGGTVGARADFFVAPALYENAEAPGSNAAAIQATPRTHLIIYHENQLSGLLGHDLVGVTFRLSNVLPNGYPFAQTTWNQYDVSLGATRTPAQSTPVFLDNFLEAPVLVRSGPLAVSANAWTVGSPPNPSPWGYEITFDQPYVYRGGALGIMIAHTGNDSIASNNLLDATTSSTPNIGIDFTTYTGNAYQAVSGTQSVFVNVARFTTQISVPEPSSLCLFLCVVFAIVGSQAGKWLNCVPTRRGC